MSVSDDQLKATIEKKKRWVTIVFRVVLIVCFIFMISYSFASFCLAYNIYITGECDDDLDNCNQLLPYANAALISMGFVFFIDQLCSVVLLISIKKIYNTIE